MTRVVVEAGICGFTTTIEVVSLSARKVGVTVTSDCETVAKMGEHLKEVRWFDIWRRQGDSYSAYQTASQIPSHITCPVPVAILKAIEVEAGLALPKDVAIQFKTVNSE